jgi:hypothetical protein
VHGLINRAIQCFIRDTFGAEAWGEICREADLGFDDFESMLTYDPALTEAVLRVACTRLGRTRESLLEDLGTWMVSQPGPGAVRRLLRFGGDSFVDFLHSLDDLHDRATLAIPDLDFPHLDLREHAANSFTLAVRCATPGFGAIVLGVLRAMADDYGALVLLDYRAGAGTDAIAISLLDAEFAQGRNFALCAWP